MTSEDLIRIRHMLDAVKEALAFTINQNREDLDNNRMLTLAIVKELEIIGEAASNLPQSLKPVSLIFLGQILSGCATV